MECRQLPAHICFRFSPLGDAAKTDEDTRETIKYEFYFNHSHLAGHCSRVRLLLLIFHFRTINIVDVYPKVANEFCGIPSSRVRHTPRTIT